MTKKFRLLTLGLIFSGVLNVVFVVAFAICNCKGAEVPLTREKKEALQKTNSQLFAAMSGQTFRELVSFLTNQELVEEGYTKRDLAVSALVSFHHFNLEKALSGLPAQTRSFQVSDSQRVEIYPGLTEEQFEAIIRYAYQEKWPLTAKGLFQILQKKEGARDESLEQAFFHTPEFYALQMFFQKTGAPQENGTLLALALEGNWELLEKVSKNGAPTADQRRELLLSYFAQHSIVASQLLLKTDFDFVLKRFDDRAVLDLLTLLKKQTAEGTKFCIDLIRSPRSDSIWQAAAMTLYAYLGEMPVFPIDPKVVLARFTQEVAAPKPAAVLPTVAASLVHIVKDGESLWKISRQYKVKVDEIVKFNGLEKESLFPGMTLKIPSQGTGSEPPR